MGELRTVGLEDLRAARRAAGEECARLSWWRRLVAARSDLLVADLTGDPGLTGLPVDDVLADLVVSPAETQPAAERLHRLAEVDRVLAVAEDEALGRLDDATQALVRRYTAEPTDCLTALPA